MRMQKELEHRGISVAHIDGDEVRKTYTKPLGFSRNDRNKHIANAIALAEKALTRHQAVVCSFVTPYAEQRSAARSTLPYFIEVFVDAPVSVCEARDPKGLYRDVRAGKRLHFTGLDDPYDVPAKPDVHIRTNERTLEECVRILLEYLESEGYVPKKGTHEKD